MDSGAQVMLVFAFSFTSLCDQISSVLGCNDEFTLNLSSDLCFLQHLFLMGYRTQPACVNRPKEKSQGAKGETLLLYFIKGTIVLLQTYSLQCNVVSVLANGLSQ